MAEMKVCIASYHTNPLIQALGGKYKEKRKDCCRAKNNLLGFFDEEKTEEITNSSILVCRRFEIFLRPSSIREISIHQFVKNYQTSFGTILNFYFIFRKISLKTKDVFKTCTSHTGFKNIFTLDWCCTGAGDFDDFFFCLCWARFLFLSLSAFQPARHMS